jgi:hypothetical protein
MPHIDDSPFSGKIAGKDLKQKAQGRKLKAKAVKSFLPYALCLAPRL